MEVGRKRTARVSSRAEFWQTVLQVLPEGAMGREEWIRLQQLASGWHWLDMISQEYYDIYAAIFETVKDEPSPSHARIEKDVTRTFGVFGKNSWWSRLFMTEADKQARFAALQRVLDAVGHTWDYCQGMNFVAATLLLELPDRDAFIVLSFMLKQRHLVMLYESKASCLVDYMNQFDKVLRKYNRRIYKHFRAIGFTSLMYTVEWFTCVFTVSASLNLASTVFDLFIMGFEDILIRVGLAVLVALEDQLLEMSLEELQISFKRMVRTLNADRVIPVALRYVVRNGESLLEQMDLNMEFMDPSCERVDTLRSPIVRDGVIVDSGDEGVVHKVVRSAEGKTIVAVPRGRVEQALEEDDDNDEDDAADRDRDRVNDHDDKVGPFRRANSGGAGERKARGSDGDGDGDGDTAAAVRHNRHKNKLGVRGEAFASSSVEDDDSAAVAEDEANMNRNGRQDGRRGRDRFDDTHVEDSAGENDSSENDTLPPEAAIAAATQGTAPPVSSIKLPSNVVTGARRERRKRGRQAQQQQQEQDHQWQKPQRDHRNRRYASRSRSRSPMDQAPWAGHKLEGGLVAQDQAVVALPTPHAEPLAESELARRHRARRYESVLVEGEEAREILRQYTALHSQTGGSERRRRRRRAGSTGSSRGGVRRHPSQDRKAARGTRVGATDALDDLTKQDDADNDGSDDDIDDDDDVDMEEEADDDDEDDDDDDVVLATTPLELKPRRRVSSSAATVLPAGSGGTRLRAGSATVRVRTQSTASLRSRTGSTASSIPGDGTGGKTRRSYAHAPIRKNADEQDQSDESTSESSVAAVQAEAANNNNVSVKLGALSFWLSQKHESDTCSDREEARNRILEVIPAGGSKARVTQTVSLHIPNGGARGGKGMVDNEWTDSTQHGTDSSDENIGRPRRRGSGTDDEDEQQFAKERALGIGDEPHTGSTASTPDSPQSSSSGKSSSLWSSIAGAFLGGSGSGADSPKASKRQGNDGGSSLLSPLGLGSLSASSSAAADTGGGGGGGGGGGARGSTATKEASSSRTSERGRTKAAHTDLVKVTERNFAAEAVAPSNAAPDPHVTINYFGEPLIQPLARSRRSRAAVLAQEDYASVACVASPVWCAMDYAAGGRGCKASECWLPDIFPHWFDVTRGSVRDADFAGTMDVSYFADLEQRARDAERPITHSKTASCDNPPDMQMADAEEKSTPTDSSAYDWKDMGDVDLGSEEEWWVSQNQDFEDKLQDLLNGDDDDDEDTPNTDFAAQAAGLMQGFEFNLKALDVDDVEETKLRSDAGLASKERSLRKVVDMSDRAVRKWLVLQRAFICASEEDRRVMIHTGVVVPGKTGTQAVPVGIRPGVGSDLAGTSDISGGGGGGGSCASAVAGSTANLSCSSTLPSTSQEIMSLGLGLGTSQEELEQWRRHREQRTRRKHTSTAATTSAMLPSSLSSASLKRSSSPPQTGGDRGLREYNRGLSRSNSGGSGGFGSSYSDRAVDRSSNRTSGDSERRAGATGGAVVPAGSASASASPDTALPSSTTAIATATPLPRSTAGAEVSATASSEFKPSPFYDFSPHNETTSARDITEHGDYDSVSADDEALLAE